MAGVQKRNKGAFLLTRTGATEEAIAGATGVTKVAAHYWRNSESKPSREKRVILKRIYDIPEPSWDEEAPTGLDAPPEMIVAPPDEPFVFDAVVDELKNHATSLLQSLRVPGASTPLERAKVMNALSGVLHTLAKTDREIGRQIFASRQWRKMSTTLAKVLASHPDAAKDVELAIETLVAESEFE